jgi:hypothetical protein
VRTLDATSSTRKRREGRNAPEEPGRIEPHPSRGAMNRYRVRAQNPRALGFITQSDHYQDYELESSDTLEDFAARLAAKGFRDTEGGRWVMPGAIVWIEPR